MNGLPSSAVLSAESSSPQPTRLACGCGRASSHSCGIKPRVISTSELYGSPSPSPSPSSSLSAPQLSCPCQISQIQGSQTSSQWSQTQTGEVPPGPTLFRQTTGAGFHAATHFDGYSSPHSGSSAALEVQGGILPALRSHHGQLSSSPRQYMGNDPEFDGYVLPIWDSSSRGCGLPASILRPVHETVHQVSSECSQA